MPDNNPKIDADVLVIGAGIVGSATARAVGMADPTLRVHVLEKEARAAAHQTGRNSGVVHSGLYYKPGSLKATTCREGRRQLIDFCRERDVPLDLCGKAVVAVDESEVDGLRVLEARAIANGVSCRRMTAEQLREREPHCSGVAALEVDDTGIVDYVAMTGRMIDDIRGRGRVHLAREVRSIAVQTDSVELGTTAGILRASVVINCGGLQCDEIFRMAGGRSDVRIVPFRGEYYELSERARELCRHLIYPVPDPAFPFLGVHLTRMIDGSVECGPNAVLAFSREGYRFRDVRLKELAATAAFGGFRKLAARHARMGLTEFRRSLSKRAFAAAVRRLVPDLRDEDLTKAPAGVRAQAVRGDGSLVDDFLIEQTPRCVHVLNAPSPAATASLDIGRQIAEQAVGLLASLKS